MKFLKTKNMYKASNVSLELSPLKAVSYDWWIFVSRIKGKTVFNDYSYSVSTRKHQSKVASKLVELGIEVDLYIEAPKGLQDLGSSIRYYESEITALQNDLVLTNRRLKTKQNQLLQIEAFKLKIKAVKKLMK